MTAVTFNVHGTPKPQGSKRHVGNGVMVEQGGEPLRTWREDVKWAALAALAELDRPLTGPLHIEVVFRLARPKGHYRTGRNAHLLREAAPAYPWGRPDLDKLARSTFDAISTAGLWTDDACAVTSHLSKTFADHGAAPGARVHVRTLDPQGAPQ